jgi:predicted transposase YdaD
MIDHDRLFKELITTFFWDFLELFTPTVLEYIAQKSVDFLPEETFTDVTSGEKRKIDILAKVKYQGKDTCFVIHIENQSY